MSSREPTLVSEAGPALPLEHTLAVLGGGGHGHRLRVEEVQALPALGGLRPRSAGTRPTRSSSSSRASSSDYCTIHKHALARARA